MRKRPILNLTGGRADGLRVSRTVLPRHTVVCHARPEAFSAHSYVLLCRLGYSMWLIEDYEKRSDDDREEDRPVLRVVDERRLGEVEEEPGWERSPIILLTGRHGATAADVRVVGAVRRPAGLHEMYRLMQQVLEINPRVAPRVPTHLHATCHRRGRQWDASILSLSENGCLLRSPQPLPLETRLKIGFELPGVGRLELEADTAYQLVPDVGLVFGAVKPSEREAIQDFVTASLA